jgi:NAD(P)-dependent dehydrogenase (short-subunit alcohol dehydrogenase family)
LQIEIVSKYSGSRVEDALKLGEKTALITGAGRGIGSAIALAFAGEGANLGLCSRTMSETEKVASQAKVLGSKAATYRVDVSNYEDVQNMVNDVALRFGRIDVLVNNAGIYGPIGPFWKNDRTEWLNGVAVNLFGTIHCIMSVLPHMIRQRGGKIINIAGGGEGPFPRFSSYACSKSAIVRLTETLAEELREHHIDVNSIAPGPVNTRLLEEILAAGQEAGDHYQKAKKQQASGGVSPEKTTALAVFLASESSTGLTGRLLSAVWDNWQELDIKSVKGSSLYQMRRIDGKRFVEAR